MLKLATRLRVLLLSAVVLVPAPISAADTLRFEADLFGDAVASGTAKYRERDRDGGIDRRFKVEVENVFPGAILDVVVDGFLAVTLVVGDDGTASATLRTPAFAQKGDLDLPAGFPFVERGDTVVVGALSGVMFRTDGMAPSTQRYKLRADAVAGDAAIAVRYRERFRDDMLMRRFTVRIADAVEGSVVPVLVNFVFIGNVVIGADAAGELQLRTAAFIQDEDDGLPMPDSFPTLVAGDFALVGGVVMFLE